MPTYLLHIYILQAICYQQRSCLPALVIDFLLFIFDPIAFFRKKCLNYLIIDQKYSVVSPYHATFNLTFLNKKNTKHFYINGKTYVLYVLGSHLLAHLSLAMANL